MESYTGISEAKNGSPIPEKGTVSFHSKYNPEREAETFADQFLSKCGFFIIFGLCGGYHIEALHKKFPESKIIVVENASSDIEFLKSIPAVKNLLSKENILPAAVNSTSDEKYKLESVLKTHYIPALHGNITISALRQWSNTFPESFELGKREITKILDEIGADFSVQRHFGKTWQKNIFQNLSQAEESLSISEIKNRIKAEKTAAIIAAGPSLNESVKKLMENRDSYCIFATDTAYQSLLKYGIESDFAITIDGQAVSSSHYLCKLSEKTTFVFDLCSSNAAVRKVISSLKNGKKRIIFTESGHPLSRFASKYDGNTYFEHLEAGSGTVTIAALNFAVKLGFKTLEVFGADFSYIDGLAYTRGTYLDTLYRKSETKLLTAETAFSRLMYRTELIKKDNRTFTTEVLNSYRNSFDYFVKNIGLKKTGENKYSADSRQIDLSEGSDIKKKFDYENFKKSYRKELKGLLKSDGKLKSIPELEKTPVFATLLPLCASISEFYESNSDRAFLAFTKTLEYTEKV